MPRILNILQSILPRQSRRLDLGLFRIGVGLTILALMAMMLPSELQRRATGTAGPVRVLIPFYAISLLLMAWITGRLSRDAVGDASGHLSIVCLTGITPSEWTLLSLLSNLIGVLSVWAVRWPFLLLFFTFGGIRWNELFLAEFAVLLIFPAINARSLVVALHATERKSAEWSGLQAVLLVELLMAIPILICNVVGVLGFRVPLFLLNLSHQIRYFGLTSHFFEFIMGAGLTSSVLLCIVPYGVVTAWWLRSFMKQLYLRVGETPEPTPTSTKDRTVSLERRPPLPRCTGNALAWQSYVYYAGGSNNTLGRVILYGFGLLIVLICVGTGFLQNFMAIVIVLAAIAMINVMNHPSRCLDNEVKAKTISSLVLTPHSGIELYRGWQRGTLWLALPDFVFATTVAILLAFVHPAFPVVIFSVMATLLSTGPLLILSPLIPFSIRGFGIGVFVVVGLILIVTCGSITGGVFSPYAFPLVAVPLFWGFNRFLLYCFVERWMQKRFEETV